MPKVPEIELKLRSKYVVRETGQEGILIGVQEEDGVCVCLLMIKGKAGSFFKEELDYPKKIPAVVNGLSDRIKKGLESIAKLPHVWVTARAGTGKTFMLVNSISSLLTGRVEAGLTQEQLQSVSKIADPYKGKMVPKVLVTSFSNAAISEIESRLKAKKLLGAGIKVQGLHGYGYAVCAKQGLVFNKHKFSDISSKLKETWNLSKKEKIVVSSLYEFCRLTMTPINDENAMKMMCTLYGFNPSNREITAARDFIKYGFDNIKEVGFDFTDMIWYPNMIDQLILHKYDLVIIDECQDLNLAQILLVEKIAKRLVICGDDRQAIGMFHGSDNQAMARLAERIGKTSEVVQLSLNGCKRCAKVIVERAQAQVPSIMAERKQIGVESVITHATMREMLKPGDLVISRNNAAVVQECVKAMGKVEVAIESSVLEEIRARIVRFARSAAMRVDQFIEDYRAMTKEWKESACNDYDKETLQDEFETVVAVAGGCYKVTDILNKLEKIKSSVYQDDVVTFSTIHKSKGKEAKRVFLFVTERSKCPDLGRTRNAEQRTQEWNLWYIAVTRAIDELYFSVSCVNNVPLETLGVDEFAKAAKAFFVPWKPSDSYEGFMKSMMSGYEPCPMPELPRTKFEVKGFAVPAPKDCPMPFAPSEMQFYATLRKKYILIPGEVVSQDGQKHRILSGELANLYHVNLNECYVAENETIAKRLQYVHGATLKILTVRSDGNYTLP